jgi:branched-chain amino acid transport system substrate-binding protein
MAGAAKRRSPNVARRDGPAVDVPFVMPLSRRRLVGALSILVAAGAAVLGCGKTPMAELAGRADSAFVGVAVGLQSPARYVNVYTGVQLALDELNKTRPARAPILALRRAPTDAKSHIDIAAAFRNDPAVIGVVGHTESDPTISAAPVYDDRAHGGKNGVVAVSPTAGSRAVTQVSEWVFRVCPVVDRQAEVLAHYMTDSLHLKRLAIIYRNDVAGREFLQTFERDTPAAALLERDPFVEEIAEFDLYARRLGQAKPDGIMVYANTNDVLKIIRAVHAAGITPAIVSNNGPSTQDLANDPIAARDFRGLHYLSLYSPTNRITAAGDRFAAAFAQRFGAAPDHWAALSYDATMLIGRAAQAVGPNRRRIRDWIARVGHGGPEYEGATGVIRYDAFRNPIDKPAFVITVPSAPVSPVASR